MGISGFGKSLVACAGVALVVALPATAPAATQVGEVVDPNSSACSQNATWLQSVSPSNRFVVPFDGVFTSWSHLGGTTPPSQLKLKVGQVGSGSFTIRGESAFATPVANTLNTFLTRVPAKAGDVIGFYFPSPNFAKCAATGQAGYTTILGTGDILPGETKGSEPDPNVHLDISALLEPDVDRDDFGDETQDGCPQQTATQAACNTAVSVRTQPGKNSVALTVNVPGAGTVTAGDVLDKSFASTAAKKKKKKKKKKRKKKQTPLFDQVSVTRTETIPGDVTLDLNLRGPGKKLLRKKGKLKANLKVVYAPRSGVSGTQPVTVTLKGKKKKKKKKK